MQSSAMYIADYMQEDVRLGMSGARGSVTEVIAKNKEPRLSSRLPLAHTLPQVLRQTFLRNSYCMMANAWQAALVTTGVLPDAPGLKRITPSSVAQKSRTPLRL
jgi:hypothetical protein